MRKHLSSIILLAILMLPATLDKIKVASATGNVTINDFNSNVTKGTVPFTTRLNGDVTGKIDQLRWDYYNPANKSLVLQLGANGRYNYRSHVRSSRSLWSF